MRLAVELGNTRVLEGGNARPDLGNQVTAVTFPDDYPVADQLSAIVDLWPSHSDADGPDWVECADDPLLAQMIARHFTTDTHICAVERPDDWQVG